MATHQYRIFTVPIIGGEDSEAELNRFLRSKRVANISREFVGAGRDSAWCFCVSVEATESAQESARNRKPKVDYKEVLSESQFEQFAQLRSLRKQIADSEGIPAYAVFTNEQLADMVRQSVGSLTALKDIDGIGAARVEKYGQWFVDALAAGPDGARPIGTGPIGTGPISTGPDNTGSGKP